MSKLNTIDARYKSREGDKLAKEELLPVVKQYLKAKNPKILEVGCGYGRNLYALSHVEGSSVVGCDIASVELEKANEKMKEYGVQNVKTVLQTDEEELPFGDNEFDCVVLWQVLEHVLMKREKQSLLNEVSRITKDGGLVFIETPNQLFPIDYHDNNLPLVHWLLPNALRRALTRAVRGRDYPPSQYTSIFELKRMLKRASGTKKLEQLTRVYFEDRYSDVFRHLSGTRLGSKKLIFILYYPLYLLLRLFRISGDAFTPSLRVVFKIKKATKQRINESSVES